ncbi:hypothetical protein VF03_33930 [Nostoc linckia z2]|nr:hypothetical protein VF03_33930 [Nostoc linckia z2]
MSRASPAAPAPPSSAEGGAPSALAAQEAGDRHRLPDPRRVEGIGAIERLDRGTICGLDEEQAADHPLAVVAHQRPGHDDPDAVRRCVREKRLVRVVVREPHRQGVGLVQGVDGEERGHRDLSLML